MAMVECHAIKMGLKTTVQACYMLEGDSPIVLTADGILERVEKSLHLKDRFYLSRADTHLS